MFNHKQKYICNDENLNIDRRVFSLCKRPQGLSFLRFDIKLLNCSQLNLDGLGSMQG